MPAFAPRGLDARSLRILSPRLLWLPAGHAPAQLTAAEATALAGAACATLVPFAADGPDAELLADFTSGMFARRVQANG